VSRQPPPAATIRQAQSRPGVPTRQATRRRGIFPNEQAALRVLFLVIRNPHRRMESALNTLAMSYGEWITGN
jgi:transposase-like protein